MTFDILDKMVGLSVVNGVDGNIVGVSTRLIFGKKKRNFKCVMVESSDEENHLLYLRFPDILRVNDRAILCLLDDGAFASNYVFYNDPDAFSLVGNDAVDESGKLIGTVSSAQIDDDAAVVSFTVRRGMSKAVFDIDRLVEVAQNGILIVHRTPEDVFVTEEPKKEEPAIVQEQKPQEEAPEVDEAPEVEDMPEEAPAAEEVAEEAIEDAAPEEEEASAAEEIAEDVAEEVAEEAAEEVAAAVEEAPTPEVVPVAEEVAAEAVAAVAEEAASAPEVVPVAEVAPAPEVIPVAEVAPAPEVVPVAAPAPAEEVPQLQSVQAAAAVMAAAEAPVEVTLHSPLPVEEQKPLEFSPAPQPQANQDPAIQWDQGGSDYEEEGGRKGKKSKKGGKAAKADKGNKAKKAASPKQGQGKVDIVAGIRYVALIAFFAAYYFLG